MEPGMMKAALHRGTEADRHFHAGDIGGEQVTAMEVERFWRATARQARRGGVHDAFEVRIVEIEAMDQGCRWRAPRRAPAGALAAAHHRAGTLAAQRGHAGDGLVGEWIGVGGEADAQAIEDLHPRPFAHGGGMSS